MRQLHKQANTIMIRGIISVVFGLIALFAPTIGLEIIVILFGAYAFADGVTAVVVGLSSPSFILFLEGVIGVIAGLYILFMTQQAVMVFIFIVGFWAIVSGMLEIVAALELRRHIQDEVWMFFVGIASIVFGVLVFLNPIVSALAITFVFGVYALMFGIFLLLLGQSIKGIKIAPAKSKPKKR
jgi:uncharacterized membrane protein HdeD (DUF308 family)